MTRPWQRAAVIAAAIVLAGMLLPARLRVERSIDIDAYPATVFALLDDFRHVAEWSGTAEEDPNARISLSGPARGVGATWTWDGRVVGHGSEVIVDSRPYDHIVTRIDTGSGREAGSTFTLDGKAGATRLSWTYERTFGFNLAARFLGLFLRGVEGSRMEADLARLADLAEALPRIDFSGLAVEQIVVESQDIAYLGATSFPAASAISDAMADAYSEIFNFIYRHGLEEDGPPLSITRSFSGSELRFDVAIPVKGVKPTTPGDERVRLGRTYAGPVLRVRHVGPYSRLGRTHEKIVAYIAALGLERNGDAWEAYVSDPGRTAEADLVTYIYYPIRD